MLHQMTDKDFEVMLNIHNLTPFRLIREAAPYFRKQADTPKTANRSIVRLGQLQPFHRTSLIANIRDCRSMLAPSQAYMDNLDKSIMLQPRWAWWE